MKFYLLTYLHNQGYSTSRSRDAGDGPYTSRSRRARTVSRRVLETSRSRLGMQRLVYIPEHNPQSDRPVAHCQMCMPACNSISAIFIQTLQSA
jgi:hypothetical protein